MNQTSVSLIQRLKTPADAAAWARFDALYRPLLQSWLRRQAVADADADDLTQETLAVVMRRLPDFEHNGRQGAFRHWLRAILANCLKAFRRQGRDRAAGGDQFQEMAARLEDPRSELSRHWEQQHDRHLLAGLLEMLAGEFEPKTLLAFRRHVLEGLSPELTAGEAGLSVGAVYIAKSRILRRLREELHQLVD